MRTSTYNLASQQLKLREPCLNFRQLIAVCRRLLWLKDRHDGLVRANRELRQLAATQRRTLILPPKNASQAVYAAALEVIEQRRHEGLDINYGAYGALRRALEKQSRS